MVLCAAPDGTFADPQCGQCGPSGQRVGGSRREAEEAFDHDIGRYRMLPPIRLPALLDAADAVLSHLRETTSVRVQQWSSANASW